MRRLALPALIVVACGIAAAIWLTCEPPPAPARGHDAAVAPLADAALAADPAAVTAGAAAEAARLSRAGLSEAAAGHYPEARSLLLRAYALDPQPATLLEVASLDHKAGRCRDARRAALGVVAAAHGDPVGQRAQALLDELGRCD